MKFVLAVILLGMLQTCLADRSARLFFATISSSTSTSTTTSTLTTTSICFTSKSAITACTSGRKKRKAEIMRESFGADEFGPSRVDRSEQLLPSEENKSYRDARLFLLSTSTSTITATATSTSTTYSATLTMSLH